MAEQESDGVVYVRCTDVGYEDLRLLINRGFGIEENVSLTTEAGTE